MSKRKRRTRSTQTRRKMSSQALLDIVIPVFNRFDILRECLDAIPRAVEDLSYNLVLVDNGSTENADDFYSFLEAPNLNLIRNPGNFGFPRACNMGANRKRSPLIFFLNSDVILNPGSLKILVKELDDPKVGVAGMMLLFPKTAKGLFPGTRPPGKVQHIGISINVQTKPIHHLIGWSEDNPKVLNQKEVTAVTGAAMLTRRSIWTKIGGFDEAYGIGTMEDVDYCISAKKLGYNIHVVPEAKATHYTGATAEKYRIGYPLQLNHLKFLDKHLQGLTWSEWECW